MLFGGLSKTRRQLDLRGVETVRRNFKARKLKAGRDGAADKRPIPERARLLPCRTRHDALRPLTRLEIRAEPHVRNCVLIVCPDRKLKRRTGIEVRCVTADRDTRDYKGLMLAVAEKGFDPPGDKAA